jgi:hypothetical protein
MPVNKKRKILTLAALVVFSAIIALHYIPVYEHSYYNEEVRIATSAEEFLDSAPSAPIKYKRVSVFVPGGFRLPPLIQDVRMPLFVLAVFYGGFFFILGPSGGKNRPS